jgi:hypothetical protein
MIKINQDDTILPDRRNELLLLQRIRDLRRVWHRLLSNRPCKGLSFKPARRRQPGGFFVFHRNFQ